jgi:hypothetical protein
VRESCGVRHFAENQGKHAHALTNHRNSNRPCCFREKFTLRPLWVAAENCTPLFVNTLPGAIEASARRVSNGLSRTIREVRPSETICCMQGAARHVRGPENAGRKSPNVESDLQDNWNGIAQLRKEPADQMVSAGFFLTVGR